MATEIDFNFVIRTQESQQYSFCSNQFAKIQHSIQSVSIQDESISLKILNLHKIEEEKFQRRSRKSISTKSQNRSSFASINDEDIKRKTNYCQNKTILSIQSIPLSYLNQLTSYHRCQNLAKSDFYNRAFGAMFGFLIGDSLGSHIINKPYNEKLIIESLMMPGGGVMNTKPGQGTDQWQICYSLCEGLIQSKGAYNRNKIALKYLQWIQSNPSDLPAIFGIALGNLKKKKRLSGMINESTLGSELKQNSLKNLKHESSLGLVRLIPLTIWAINLQQYQFNQIIKEQMSLITPNQFVIETALIYANILKCILTTGNHLLAFNKASTYIYKFGSQKLIDLWNIIEEGKEPLISNVTSNNLKFPLYHAMNQLLCFDHQGNCKKKAFINSALNLLSKGFNTDTNCSIGLGLIGATLGYNNIPSFYKTKILNCEQSNRKRQKYYSSTKIVDLVTKLIKYGPLQLQII